MDGVRDALQRVVAKSSLGYVRSFEAKLSGPPSGVRAEASTFSCIFVGR